MIQVVETNCYFSVSLLWVNFCMGVSCNQALLISNRLKGITGLKIQLLLLLHDIGKI